MRAVDLQAVPAQSVKVVLGDQNVEISVYQKDQGLFVDVIVAGADIVRSIIARDSVPIVCRDYAGFVGNLMFIDNQGASDPDYTGLADRFSLVYLDAEENALIQQ